MGPEAVRYSWLSSKRRWSSPAPHGSFLQVRWVFSLCRSTRVVNVSLTGGVCYKYPPPNNFLYCPASDIYDACVGVIERGENEQLAGLCGCMNLFWRMKQPREKLINLQILLIFFNKIVILKKGVGVFSLWNSGNHGAGFTYKPLL